MLLEAVYGCLCVIVSEGVHVMSKVVLVVDIAATSGVKQSI